MQDQIKYLAKLKGQKVLVIGGSAGIGYAASEAAVEHGCEVYISSSQKQRVEAAVDRLKQAYPSASSRILGHVCDMSDEQTLETGNAIIPTPIADATLEAMRAAATVRYTAPVLIAKHAPKFLRQAASSSITLTTGVVSEKPIPGWSVTAGPRTAVQGLTRNLALDLRPIRVNAVCLGAVDTDTWSHMTPEDKDKTFAALVQKTTTGVIAQASEVAEAYVYCMKDNNVTGSIIHTNGGVLLT
ncbi:hypothetical protein NM208_g3139 [Fusarium decemcellulare]|uniref:Uncharacterized protein n=1 Tax=Fusarium decemcellulare TaxID=57161 RepID=A0ACC1SQ28_9HYPO|nr:hypothetical protein NM208_g3139 [Fusarium decemcellulare]